MIFLPACLTDGDTQAVHGLARFCNQLMS